MYDIQRLAVKFPHLTHFAAPQHSKQLPWRELFAGLCLLKELKYVSYGGRGDRQVLSDLVELPGVRNLWIDSTGADAAELQPLSRLTQLTTLSLHSDFKGDDALDCLKGLVQLQELEVVWTSSSDQSSPLPSFPTSITKLVLLVDCLPEVVCLGAHLAQLAQLQDLSLTFVDLDKILPGRYLTALGSLAQLSSLAFDSNYDWKHGALAVLKDCLALHSLTIGSSHVTDKALLDLSQIPGLKALHVDRVQLSDLLTLSRLSALTSLRIGCIYQAASMQVCLTQLDSMDFLRAMPGLQEFRVYRCKEVSSSALNSLSCLNQLAALELPYCSGVDPDFLMQLMAMTCLTRLNLSRNPWLQTEFASALVALSALVELDLSESCNLSEVVLQYIQEKPNLRKLSLAGNDWLGGVGVRSGLTGLVTLEVLDLDNCCNVTEDDLVYACERLRLLQLRVRGLRLSASGRLRLQGPMGVCKVWPKFLKPGDEIKHEF